MDQPIRPRRPNDPPPEQPDGDLVRLCREMTASNAREYRPDLKSVLSDQRAQALQDRYGAFPGHAV